MVKTPLIGLYGSGHIFNRKTTFADLEQPISQIIKSITPCKCGNKDIERFSLIVAQKTYLIKCIACDRYHEITVHEKKEVKKYDNEMGNES